MSKWRKKQLQEIAFLKPTETLKKGDIAPNIPMANIKEFQRDVLKIDYGEFRGGTKFRNGDTLLAKITPCLENGKTAFVNCLQEDEIGFGSTEFIVLRAKENIDERFLYYLSISPEFRKQAISLMEGTSGRKRVNENALKISDFLIPGLEEQRKIANILSAIDDKIQINNQINQELEAMTKTLYDYWFVQFDFPDQNGKPYKSSGGKMVYNPELKREIPEGWGVTTFSSWISDNKTGDWGKETSQGNYKLEVDCIRGADINGLSGNGKTDMPTRFILEKNKNKLLTDFDIVIEISGGSPTQSTGRIVGISENVLNRFDLPLICSNFCKAVSLKEQETFYNFVYEWKNLYDNGVLFSWEGKTSGIKNLLFDSFVTNYHIAQPPIGLMEQFFDYASSVDRKIQLLLKQNQELTQLRDWLLPMLMNGQVKVE